VINRDVQSDDDLMSRVIPGEVLEVFNSGSVPMLSRHEEQDAHEIFNIITGSLCDSLESREGYQYLNSVQSQLRQDTRHLATAESEQDQLTTVVDVRGDADLVRDCELEILPQKPIQIDVKLSGGDAEGNTPFKPESGVTSRIDKPSLSHDLKIQELLWTDNLTPFTGLFASQLQCIYCFQKARN